MNFSLDEKVIENIVKILEKYEEVKSAKIFGSRARGDYRKSSDIDIALFGDDLTHSKCIPIWNHREWSNLYGYA